ncbi:MAG: indole-3-glycerol phosphate synthase TrpC [Lachnospiraceae bacterium]|nr:indole-3-glycerol phosphate synthase TrpC [Lachnospiraceae bacterium]
MTILDKIAEHAKERVALAKERIPLSELKRMAFDEEKGDFAFFEALKKPGLSFILECKKASPSKGIIAEKYDWLSIAKAYEAAGADAISVLTEPKWFLGRNEYLKEIAASVRLPVLRKDFTVDEYMLYEAKLLGAKAVLLIVSILSKGQIEEYLGICEELGISALVEAHDEAEAERAVMTGAEIIGVNNRNLKDFSVDTKNAARLKDLIPPEVLFVSESGVKDEKDIRDIISFGADAVLIGETMMRAEDKTAALKRLKGGMA